MQVASGVFATQVVQSSDLYILSMSPTLPSLTTKFTVNVVPLATKSTHGDPAWTVMRMALIVDQSVSFGIHVSPNSADALLPLATLVGA